MQAGKYTEEEVEYEVEVEPKESGFTAKLQGFLAGPYFFAVVFALVAVIAFFLGRASGLGDKREPVRVINTAGEVRGASTLAEPDGRARPPALEAAGDSGKVVASKNGTKYHAPWCAGAKQISEKNKIVFESVEVARAAGYTPAANCPGLK